MKYEDVRGIERSSGDEMYDMMRKRFMKVDSRGKKWLTRCTV